MKTAAHLILAAVLFVGWVECRATEAPSAFTNIETSFVERGVLSPTEISNVLVLAGECGVTNPVGIRTLYFDPIDENWTYLIEVKGRETVSGRRISCVTVDVWRHQADAKKLKSLGEFWVADGEVRTNEFATFSAGNRTFRVATPRSLPIETADKILAAFAAKRIQYPDGQKFLQETIEQEDFSTPNELNGPDENGKYKATKGGHSGWEVEFKLENDTIKITTISSFIS